MTGNDTESEGAKYKHNDTQLNTSIRHLQYNTHTHTHRLLSSCLAQH